MYYVIDFYENPFGEKVYLAHSMHDATTFCDNYAEEVDGECNLKIQKIMDY